MECFNNWQKGLGVLFTKGKLFQLSVHSCYFCCFLCFRKHRKISLLAHEVFVLIDYHWALWEIRTLNPSRISVELQHSGDSPRFQSKEFNSEGLQLWHNESTELMFQHGCLDRIEGHWVSYGLRLTRFYSEHTKSIGCWVTECVFEMDVLSGWLHHYIATYICLIRKVFLGHHGAWPCNVKALVWTVCLWHVENSHALLFSSGPRMSPRCHG